MQREIMLTTDGSHSVWFPGNGLSYHSRHGAIQESMHVFIESGLQTVVHNPPGLVELAVFEMGLGTGLNALLTLIEAERLQQAVYYEAIEADPLPVETWQSLNYCEQLGRTDLLPVFKQLHCGDWGSEMALTPWFRIKKIQDSLLDYTSEGLFHLVYFDAFAPEVQPELWTETIFKKLFHTMHEGGVLTTYCSKSIVRKAMTAAGFTVEKIPGPPHKREMVRAHTFAAL